MYCFFNRFVIDEAKNKRIISDIDGIKLQEQSSSVVDKDGRYPCRAPSCSKTFAQNGKWRKDHEATHNPPVIIEEPIVNHTLNLHVPPDQRDDMLCYQKALKYGMLLLNSWDAISMGDGGRILRCWKYFLLYLHNEEGSTVKYSLEALYLMCQVHAILSLQAAHRLIWIRSVKNKAGPGGNIPLDLQLEFFNKILKGAVKNLRPNVSKKSLDHISHAMGVTNQLLYNFDQEVKVIKRSGRHVQQSTAGDLKKLVDKLIEERQQA